MSNTFRPKNDGDSWSSGQEQDDLSDALDRNDLLLSLMLDGEATDSQREEFELLIQQNPTLKQDYMLLSDATQQLRHAEPVSPPIGLTDAILEATTGRKTLFTKVRELLESALPAGQQRLGFGLLTTAGLVGSCALILFAVQLHSPAGHRNPAPAQDQIAFNPTVRNHSSSSHTETTAGSDAQANLAPGNISPADTHSPNLLTPNLLREPGTRIVLPTATAKHANHPEMRSGGLPPTSRINPRNASGTGHKQPGNIVNRGNTPSLRPKPTPSEDTKPLGPDVPNNKTEVIAGNPVPPSPTHPNKPVMVATSSDPEAFARNAAMNTGEYGRIHRVSLRLTQLPPDARRFMTPADVRAIRNSSALRTEWESGPISTPRSQPAVIFGRF